MTSESGTASTRSRNAWGPHVVLLLSGFSGLGYEMVWTRMLSTGLGHEILSVLCVLAAFFCGSSAGAWWLHGLIRKAGRPGLWYAALEAVVGLWAFVVAFIMPWANRFVSTLMGPDPSPAAHWAFSFAFPFLLLLPATFAMGATLPAMERLVSGLLPTRRRVGGLYAANTFGAVTGTIVTTFVVIPLLGHRSTMLILAAVNLICAMAVAAVPAWRGKMAPGASVVPPAEGTPRGGRILGWLFLTGFLGIGFEVLVVRAVSQVFENTVFSFAALLCVCLFGTAAGAALYQRLVWRSGFEVLLSRLLSATSAACLVGVLLLNWSEPLYRALQKFGGGGTSGAVLGETGLALVVFLAPTMAMGATFSHLAQAARERDGSLGRALCLNTLGAAAAPFVFGVLLLPAMGVKIGLVITALGYLLALPSFRPARLVPALIPVAAAVVLVWSPVDLRHVSLYPGDRVTDYVEGVMATVVVVQDSRGDTHLKVNDHFQMGGTSSYYSDRRQGNLPLLLHPHPRSALFLGIGTGTTLAAAADHPGLDADGVELVPEVVPLISRFEKSTGDFAHYGDIHIHVADARLFVASTPRHYDVIVADLFHPARDGAGSLYTKEHFEAIRAKLNPGGLFCQWLPIYQLDMPTLRVIVRTFLGVFPGGSAYLAHFSLKSPILALVSGRDGRLSLPSDWFEKRVEEGTLQRKLDAIRLDSVYSVLGCFLGSGEELAAFAGPGPLNTDDRPLVTYLAPKVVYSELPPPSERLMEIVGAFHPKPSDVLDYSQTPEDERTAARLASYWAARNEFLRVGMKVPETNDVSQLLASARDDLLNVVRMSPDFAAAYNPLLGMAVRLYDTDRESSHRLLLDLVEVNPGRNDARRMLTRLFRE